MSEIPNQEATMNEAVSEKPNQRIPFEVVGADSPAEAVADVTVIETVVAETPAVQVVATVDESEISAPDAEVSETVVEKIVAEKESEVVADAVAEIETVIETEVVAEIETEVVAEPVSSETKVKVKVKTKKAPVAKEMIHEVSAFEELGLSPEVITAIENSGYSTPTPIQSETIPYVVSGDDLIGSAETGSGKTAAFACPLLSKLDMSITAPQVLVLAPTRELAIQVTAAFQKYGASLPGFRAVTIYGGQSYETQHNQIRRGVHVVVGTPGRMMDHMRQGTIDLSNLKTFVLDEADEMLRMGFIDDVEWILEQLPKKRQILLFSATMPAPIQRIAQTYLKKPVTVAIKSDTATADSIQQTCVMTNGRAKLDNLVQILESEESEGVIVFVKTRNTTVQIADQLTQKGFSAAPLNGEIPQNQRERTINALKSGRLNVLVATDVAARGLDVQRISHVINYDFPHDTEAYIHRIGRTGRAGRTGAAILFVEPKEQGKLKRLQRDTNQRIATFKQKSLKEINDQRIDKFKQKITESLADDSQLNLYERIVAEYQAETETPIEQIAAALALLAQADVPLLLKEIAVQSNWKNDRERGGERGGKREGGRRPDSDMTTYRIEVGRNHGVGPGNIVGAITNEANLDNSNIGRIRLFEDFSTIDLPSDLSNQVIEMLQSVVVSGQPLRIAKDRGPGGSRQTSPIRKGNNGSTKFGKRKSSDRSPGYKSSEARSSYKPSDGKPGYRSSDAKPAYKPSTSSDSQDGKKPYRKSTEEKPVRAKSALQKSSFGKSVLSKSTSGEDSTKKNVRKPYVAKSSEGETGGGKSAKRKSPMRKFVKIRGAK